jgi:hypothetical protein
MVLAGVPRRAERRREIESGYRCCILLSGSGGIVVRRDRHFWLKVLIGLVFAILVVDVLALTCVVVPLAASQQKHAEPPAFSPRLTNSPAEQALILPTRDPRKPWVTRTPRPTPTPWLILAATLTPQLPATPASAENASQVAADATGVVITPESGGIVAPGTPSPQATVIQSVGSPSPISSAPQSVEPTGLAQAELTDTPTPAGMLPTETQVAPFVTPSPTWPPGTDQPPPPIVPGDQAQFTTYVMDQYATIAGQALTIATTTLDITDAGAARVVVDVAGDDENNVFAAQTAAAALDYGHRLLNDLKYYFNGQNCVIEVTSTYVTSNGDACKNYPTWCTLDTFDASANTWIVTRTYVRGTSDKGSDSVETGNTVQ